MNIYLTHLLHGKGIGIEIKQVLVKSNSEMYASILRQFGANFPGNFKPPKVVKEEIRNAKLKDNFHPKEFSFFRTLDPYR